MKILRRIAKVENAWHPSLLLENGSGWVAWRDHEPDRPVAEPESIRVALLRDEAIGDPRTVVAGWFHGTPRLVRTPNGVRLLAVRRSEDVWRLESWDVSGDGSVALSDPDCRVTGFAAHGSGEEAFVAWIEVGSPGARLVVLQPGRGRRTVISHGPIWSPVATRVDDGPVVAWERGGDIMLAALDDELNVRREARVALAERRLGRPDIRGAGETVFLSCISDGLWSRHSERLKEDTRIHAFRWRDGDLDMIGGQPDGVIPVETTSRFEHYRDEAPENRRLPVAPACWVGSDGRLRVFFRHFRDAQQNDWGWTLRVAREGPAGFEPPEDVVREAGYPDGQFSMADRGDGLLLVTTEADFPVWDQAFSPRGKTGPPRIALYALEPERSGETGPWVSASAASPTVTEEERELRPRWGDYRLVFADMHRHSIFSRCVPEADGDVMEHMRWARDHERLGGMCLTDHWLHHTSSGEQRAALAGVDAARRPGRFAPIFGVEPASWPGMIDINLYWPDLETTPHIERIIREHADDVQDAMAYIRENDLVGRILMERHYHGMGLGAENDRLVNCALARDEEIEPVIEVIQSRGDCIPFYCRMLQAGLHKGVTGGSDHCRPTDRRHAFCLTGLWVREVTAEGLWEALRARRCFATGGLQAEVRLHAPGAIIGETAARTGPVDVAWEVRSPEPLADVTIYRDGFPAEVFDYEGRSSAAGTVRAPDAGGAEVSYFLVARTCDGTPIISSPLWLRTPDNP